ncbi:MAG: alginate lyase family protein, partial [Melioribacteraceae bacterium]
MMNKNIIVKIVLALFLVSNLSGQESLPKIYSGDSQKLYSLRKAYRNGELKDDKDIKSLIRQADKLLNMTPLSVTEKSHVPLSGDKHDFVSMAPYWWPNPDTKDGLPYIRKDGEKNPEIFKIADDEYLARLNTSVTILSAAYYITGNTEYSSKAAELLRVWFLDGKTNMNPNLNYAQYIPGQNTGRGAGIIDTHGIYRILDAVGLLQNSAAWTDEDNLKIKKWFDDYLNWLRTSKNGIHESKTKNNHGSWYDV